MTSNNEDIVETSVDDQLLCSICNKLSDDPQCFSCGHRFCQQCITQKMEKNHVSCPICRQSASVGGLSNEQTTFHSQNIEQQDQLPTAFLFEPVRSLLNDLIHQNKQLKEEINQLKKESQLQYETFLDQSIEQSKKNEQFQVETNKLKQKIFEHETEILKLKTGDQNQKIKMQEIDQQYNLLEITIKPLTSIVKCSPDTKWKQLGLTIAGGNDQKNKLNQLSHPSGIFINDDQTIYIADCENHRIVEWKSNATNGPIVAGGNEKGHQMNQLAVPTDVIIDKENDCFIIADHGNNRIMRWSRQNNTNGEIIISNIDCWSLTMDKDGSLYVSDCENNEVRRWKRGEKNGSIVAGGNGKGTQLNQLNTPTFIFVDQDYSLYVSDMNNHRVMKWLQGAKQGIIVAGGNGPGKSLKQFSCPWGVSVDGLDQIYVVDGDNNRVMRWCRGAKEGTIVVGGNGEGRQSNQFYSPKGLAFDRQGNLYVVDWGNVRIQKFEIDRN